MNKVKPKIYEYELERNKINSADILSEQILNQLWTWRTELTEELRKLEAKEEHFLPAKQLHTVKSTQWVLRVMIQQITYRVKQLKGEPTIQFEGDTFQGVGATALAEAMQDFLSPQVFNRILERAKQK